MWVLIKNALARALQLHIGGGSQLLPNLEFDYQIAFTKRVGALEGGVAVLQPDDHGSVHWSGKVLVLHYW
jgi:hypothetical protein